MHAKKWILSLKSVAILAQCRYTKIAQRIFKHSDIQYISFTPDKILNSMMYRTLFYVNKYGSYKLLKRSGFWPTLYIVELYLVTFITNFTCGLTAKKPGSAPCLTLVKSCNQVWDYFILSRMNFPQSNLNVFSPHANNISTLPCET